jgi:phosphoglycolate phosphatase/putative hydrolase of the HAD superfamily
MANMEIDWSSIRLVILDVDGTLYRQRPLRIRMLFRLLSYFLIRPHRWKSFYWLHRFRSMREHIPSGPYGEALESYQYRIPAEALGIDPQQVRQVVARWIHQEPLPYLKACKYPEVDSFLQGLSARGISYTFYSDYPLQEKLRAMEIPFSRAFSSEDVEIDRMKPDPAGLEYIRTLHGLEPGQCLMIGDRHEKDGKCAEAASMPCLIIDQSDDQFYTRLYNRLQSALPVE